MHAGAETTIRYDRLVAAAGAKPVRPEMPGCKLDGVFLLHKMGDSFAVQARASLKTNCGAMAYAF